MPFERLLDLRMFGFVFFLFLLVSWKGCGLSLWHSRDFSHTIFFFKLQNLLTETQKLVGIFSVTGQM